MASSSSAAIARPLGRILRYSAIVNAGVSVQWTPCISTYVSYDGQLGRDRYDSNGVSGGFRISF
jgi:outer membrane autotransporter protein